MASIDDLIRLGLDPESARQAVGWIAAHVSSGNPQDAWRRISRELLTPAHPFDLHRRLYEMCYGDDALLRSPGPAWFPSPETIAFSNIAAVLQELQLPDYPALHRWSIDRREAYWELAMKRLDVRLRQPYERLLDSASPTRPRWLLGARLNIVESCFAADPSAPAVLESDGYSPIRATTYAELRAIAGRVANALCAGGIGPGDTVAMVLPMTAASVATYLGVIAVGAAVVSIPDSFAPAEIATRLRLGGARLVFTQDALDWGAKRIALYEKVKQASDVPVVVCRAAFNPDPAFAPRPGDQRWDEFLSSDDRLTPIPREPHDPINILFSSGTTGEPKAIPWDQTTPIKCAADAHFHNDLHPGDVSCWPTNLGWMMGPWLIFATLMNRGTMALYAQAPHDGGFGRFVERAGVNMLGCVPSLVRAWRQSDCMRGLDWSKTRAFSSTGECSNAADSLYLMHLAGYRPVIEYCGGTEIGGAYLTSTVVQPNIPSAFSTPALGLDLVLIDERGNPVPHPRAVEDNPPRLAARPQGRVSPTEDGDPHLDLAAGPRGRVSPTGGAQLSGHPSLSGEAFLIGPSIGLSMRLLNRDHDAVYYKDTPRLSDGTPLRRHGDELEFLPNGYYRVAGRSDDTMNLGGIKIGCAEIERALAGMEGILETAAIAVPPPGGGPSRLVIFAVPTPSAAPVSAADLKSAMQKLIRERLNPLFAVHEVCIVPSLPRTASNKVMRRELRAGLSGFLNGPTS